MKKGMYLFVMVGFMVLAGLAEAVSGFVLWFVLPSGGGRRGLELAYLGLTRHAWIDIHDWMAIALIIIVIIHLLVHWKWVIRMTRQIFMLLTETSRSIKGSSSIKQV
jgi:hypothetical protein